MNKKKWALGLGLVTLGLIWAADAHVRNSSQGHLFTELSQLPAQPVGLVLGASPYLRSGAPNPYFTHRIKAAAALYHAHKVSTLVVSGDNRRDDYNEPEAMQQALIALGVPEARIYLDFAGLRTLDSVVRMDKIFGQQRFIIVSQPFHNERAVYLATQHGLTAYAYNAADVRLTAFTPRAVIREKLARVKVVLDVWQNKQPRHLGEPITIQPPEADGGPSSPSNKDS